MSSEINKLAAKSLAIVGSSQIVIRFISFTSTIVLARLLAPEDYGVMAMAMVVVGFITLFNEVGISSAIVQRPNLLDKEITGCFYLATLFGLFCWLIAYLGAGPAASFFNQALLADLIPVLATGLIFGAMGAVSTGLLRKEMRFKDLSAIGILAILLKTAVTLTLAFKGYGVWSLVVGSVVSAVFRLFAVFYRAGWYPKTIGGVRDSLPVIKYGLNITSTRILWWVYGNADNLILGKLLGDAMLGLYTMAYTLATLPTSHITGIVVNVSSPVFAKLQDDREELRRSLRGFVKGIAYLTFPALGGLFITADELIVVVIGEKWQDCILPFKILCVLGLWKSIDPVLTQVLISTGHASFVARYTLMCSIVVPLSVLMGTLHSGIVGAATAWVISYPLAAFYLFQRCKKLYDLGFLDTVALLRNNLLYTTAMIVAVYAIKTIGFNVGLSSPLVLLLEVMGGASVYLLLISMDRGCISEMRMFLSNMGISDSRLNFWPLNRT